MLISDVISMLRDSILKQIRIGEEDPTLINFINLGVLEIHKRFRLSHNTATINTVVGKTDYSLGGIDADVDINLTTHELLLVERMADSQDNDIPINKLIDGTGTKLVSYNTIRLGDEENDSKYTVYYRSSPVFTYSLDSHLQLSPVFMDALLHYVAYQAYLSVNGEEQTQHSLHKKRFEDSIKRVSENGLYIHDDLTKDQLTDRNFI